MDGRAPHGRARSLQSRASVAVGWDGGWMIISRSSSFTHPYTGSRNSLGPRVEGFTGGTLIVCRGSTFKAVASAVPQRSTALLHPFLILPLFQLSLDCYLLFIIIIYSSTVASWSSAVSRVLLSQCLTLFVISRSCGPAPTPPFPLLYLKGSSRQARVWCRLDF